MTWEGVPWMVANAEHSAEVGRVLAYAAIGRSEGIIAPTDCKVTASAIADGNIHIGPGAVGVLNRSEGGSSQAYLLRNVGDEVKALTPQGSSGVRYDLVAVVVKDPQYAGQPAPPSVEDGPYLETRIYPNVPSTTTSLVEVDSDQTGLALALVKFDASDGTVNTADITDLRKMLKPEVQIEKRIRSLQPLANLVASGAGAGIAPPGSSFPVRIPEWATHVQLEGIWSGVQFVDAGSGAGHSQGVAQVKLGDALFTTFTQWLVDATGATKPVTETIMAARDLPCYDQAGQTLNLQGIIVTTNQSGMTGRTTEYTTAILTATFLQRPI